MLKPGTHACKEESTCQACTAACSHLQYMHPYISLLMPSKHAKKRTGKHAYNHMQQMHPHARHACSCMHIHATKQARKQASLNIMQQACLQAKHAQSIPRIIPACKQHQESTTPITSHACMHACMHIRTTAMHEPSKNFQDQPCKTCNKTCKVMLTVAEQRKLQSAQATKRTCLHA